MKKNTFKTPRARKSKIEPRIEKISCGDRDDDNLDQDDSDSTPASRQQLLPEHRKQLSQ